jgi:hypothetical protein
VLLGKKGKYKNIKRTNKEVIICKEADEDKK